MSALAAARGRAIAIAWPVKARLDWLRLRASPPAYSLDGRTYRVHIAWYNKTWRNERQVEIPAALEIVASHPPEALLEVGNVLSHYAPIRHAVIDKYERSPVSLPVDVVDYEPGRRFGAIIAISTLEHVGFDEPDPDPAKFRRALQHLAGLLEPGGLLWASVPLGHNPAADAFLAAPDPGYRCSFLVRRSRRPGDWQQAPTASPADHPYDTSVPTANAVGFLSYRAAG